MIQEAGLSCLSYSRSLPSALATCSPIILQFILEGRSRELGGYGKGVEFFEDRSLGFCDIESGLLETIHRSPGGRDLASTRALSV